MTTALGVLGMPGFTAYAGLTQIGHPKAGETVVVAAASGPVGATSGSSRRSSAPAVGIAGGPRKVAYLRELGFDEAIDHRAPALLSAILVKVLTICGFIQTEFAADLMGEFLERATPWVRDGSLQRKEDTVDGLESAPEVFLGMLDGKNFGKRLLRVI